MQLLILVWIVATAFITYISRRSLKQPWSHGFYRFFAWESILTLAILNIQGWFENPLAPHQLISWFLLISSIIPLVLGVGLLKREGASRGKDQGSPNFPMENTSRLVTRGIFARIRHPLYASLLYLTWGLFVKDPRSVVGLLLALTASLFIYLTARQEEKEDILSFGAEYQAYMQKTKRFIPFIF